jgi:hypothetical protein
VRTILNNSAPTRFSALLGIFAALLSYFLGDSFSDKTHGFLLGTLAIIFAIAETFFRNLLTELNALLRNTSFSKREMERLRALILPKKRQLWMRWFLLTGYKVAAGACGAILLSSPSLDFWTRKALLALGYSSIAMSVIWIWSLYKNLMRIDQDRDDLAMQEIVKREIKKLTTDLEKIDKALATSDAPSSYKVVEVEAPVRRPPTT